MTLRAWASRHAVALVVLAAMAGLLGVTIRTEGLTADEPYHASRALAYWWTGGTHLSWAHPPLANALAGLPHAAKPDGFDITKVAGYANADTARLGPTLFERHWGVVRPRMWASRAMMAALALAFAAYVYAVCSRAFDRVTGHVALAFVALHPFLLGHGKLVTTDAPLTCFLGIALLELVAWLQGGAGWRALTMSLACGAAFATKFSAMFFLPVLFVAPLVFALLRLGRFRDVGRVRGVATAVGVVALAGVLSVGVVNAAYRFEGTLQTREQLVAQLQRQDEGARDFRGLATRADSPLAKLPASMPIPLPARYLHGLASVVDHRDEGHNSWYWGEIGVGGWKSYFPMLLLIKTPTTLLLSLVAGVLMIGVRRRAPSAAAWVLGAFAATVLYAGYKSTLNIGVRHVMPIIVPLCVLAARAVAVAWERWGAHRIGRFAFAGLAAAHVAGVAIAFPDYVGDFNWLVGGRRGGQKISVVGEDWGQDTLRLVAALRRRKLKEVHYVPTASPSPSELEHAGIEVHGLKCKKKVPAGKWVAIHATKRVRDAKGCYAWLVDRAPDAQLGGHIGLWKVRKED